MTEDLRAMLDGCRDDPDNNLRHLVLADYVRERGLDAWADLIQVSVEGGDVRAAQVALADWMGWWPSPHTHGDGLILAFWSEHSETDATWKAPEHLAFVRRGVVWDRYTTPEAAGAWYQAILNGPAPRGTGESPGPGRTRGRRARSPRGRTGTRSPS